MSLRTPSEPQASLEPGLGRENSLGMTSITCESISLSCRNKKSSAEAATSIIGQTVEYVAFHPRMFSPAFIASLPDIDILEILSRRSAVRSLCDLAGDPFLLQRSALGQIYLHVTSDGGVSTLPMIDDAQCSSGALSIDSELAWVSHKAYTGPRGPIGKFQREFENVLAKCEAALPQQRRLEFVFASDAALEGRQRLSCFIGTHRKELEYAENSVFLSSVFRAITTELCEDDETVREWMGFSAPSYFTASIDDKAQAIGTMFRHRLAILHDGLGHDCAADESFLKHVLGIWLHMIKFSGKLTTATFTDPPGTVHLEGPYGPPAHDNEYFPSPLSDMLPGILAYFRRDTEISSGIPTSVGRSNNQD